MTSHSGHKKLGKFVGVYIAKPTNVAILTAKDNWTTAPSILTNVNLKISRQNLLHRYSACGKTFQIGIVPVANSKHTLQK